MPHAEDSLTTAQADLAAEIETARIIARDALYVHQSRVDHDSFRPFSEMDDTATYAAFHFVGRQGHLRQHAYMNGASAKKSVANSTQPALLAFRKVHS